MAPNSIACIWCDCGAKYERAEMRLPIKDVGIFECFGCGAVVERWHGKLVPAFKLIALPNQKVPTAA